MESWLLEVTVISATDLKKVRKYLRMHPYVVASLYGDEGHGEGQRRTPPDEKGDTSPYWNHALAPPFAVDVAAALDDRLTLKLEIKTERTFKPHKDVGWVDVPVRKLLEEGGDGMCGRKSFPVRLHSGGTKGNLELSYKFGEASTVPGAPPDQQPPKKGKGWVGGVIIGNAIWDKLTDAFDDVEG